MSATSPLNRRAFLARSAAVGAASLLSCGGARSHPGRRNPPLLRQYSGRGSSPTCAGASPPRWPERETVGDRSQGVQLATTQELVRYWATDYDWRKAEARLNALPQFITEIDGLDIHFIHVRSRNMKMRCR